MSNKKYDENAKPSEINKDSYNNLEKGNIPGTVYNSER